MMIRISIKQVIQRWGCNLVIRITFILLYLYLFLLLVMFNLSSANDTFNNSYYSDKERGWFWYKEEALEEKIKETNILDFADEEKVFRLLQSPNLLEKELTAKELKILLPKSLELATDEPSISNVYTYYALQKQALQKGNNFADKAQEVLLLYPELSELSKFASFPAAKDIDFRVKQEEQEQLIRNLANNSYLVFFYKGSCPYCKLSVVEINMLKKYGFSIIGISLDKEVLEGIEFDKHYFMDLRDIKVNVTKVPTLFVYNKGIDTPKNSRDKIEKDTNVIMVSSGLVKVSDMLDRLASIARIWNY